MDLDDDQRERMCRSGDPRFDGWFTVAITSTGIYCRPSCPSRPPKRANMRFFPTPAAAQAAGFRACKRCRPDASPGSPEWNVRADAVGRAMRLIADGLVDREGVDGLARRLGYSTRHLTRLVTDELGTGPLAIARAQRAQTARILIETTSLPFTEVAFAAGFQSIRQFNDVVRTVFAATPTDLRARSRSVDPSGAGTVRVRLAHRTPFDAAGTWAFLAARAVPGVEHVDTAGTYRRALRLPHGTGDVALTIAADAVVAELRLDAVADLAAAVQRCRRLLDLDADPVAVDDVLRGLGPPGARVPGAVDGWELAARAVVGQQVSLASARRTLARLCAAGPSPSLFPAPEAVAALDPATLPLPRRRAATLVGLAASVADGQIDLDPGADRDETRARLLAVPGVGPWTADYVLMRALGHPDVLLVDDLVVRRELGRRGLDPAAASAAWSPWRSYATVRLWAAANSQESTTRGAA